MSIEEELAQLSPKKDMLLTIGVFDGVHLGHKALISELTHQAARRGLISGVLTFRQHPQSVLMAREELPHLTSLSQKTSLLKDEGVDAVIAISFTPEVVRLSALEFVSRLKKYLRMSGLVVGTDFALGRGREGDTTLLSKIGQTVGFSVTVVPQAKIDGQVVSSTVVRNALASGDMKKVYDTTGRYFRLKGSIVTGAGRGAGLGFPTANLDVDPNQALPLDGVYVALAYINDQVYPAMTNIGNRPTFGRGRRVVEAHILDYQGDLYGSELVIDIIERLRGEMRFSSVVELKEQIKKDIKKGRAILKSRGIK